MRFRVSGGALDEVLRAHMPRLPEEVEVEEGAVVPEEQVRGSHQPAEGRGFCRAKATCACQTVGRGREVIYMGASHSV